jgi:hypothetical protein
VAGSEWIAGRFFQSGYSIRLDGKRGLMGYTEILSDKRCPLCELPAEELEVARDHSRTLDVSCQRCGMFNISDQVIEVLPAGKKHLLSAVCRTWAGRKPLLIRTDTIEGLIKQAPHLSIADQMDSLLEMLARKTQKIGKWSEFDPQADYPLLGVSGRDEVDFLIQALAQRNYVTHAAAVTTLTVAGWERLEEIKRAGRASALAFVAMWFDESVKLLYDEAIRPAIREAGYEPLRIDRHDHLNRIDDEIIGQIRRSRFMVADFTGQRGGVYFEAGMMKGLGRNVIWMCKKQELDEGKLHFDIRQYNFIAWESVEDARVQLSHRIRAIEGEGPIVAEDLPKIP